MVDLRGNTGGDMIQMLTVVAPLLGEGKKGAFVGPDGTRTDRTGRTYGNAPIAPHTLVDDGDALTAAIEWLSEQA